MNENCHVSAFTDKCDERQTRKVLLRCSIDYAEEKDAKDIKSVFDPSTLAALKKFDYAEMKIKIWRSY